MLAFPDVLLPMLLAVPLVTGVVAWRLPVRWSERTHVAGSVLLLGTAWSVAGQVFATGPLSLGGWLYVDALSALLLGVVALVGCGAAAYAVGYLRRDVTEGRLQPDQPRWFALWYQLFLATMLAVLLAENLGLMWVAVEATTLTSALLVGFYRTELAVEAAWKYLLLCTVGITLALFGVLLVYYAGVRVGAADEGMLSWRALVALAPRLDPDLVKLAFVFALVGYGTKAGFAPLHTWLPDAHSQAPTPVSAVLSGVLLPCALYAILRFHAIATGTLGPSFSSNLLLMFGVLSAAVAVPFVLLQHDLKRLLAYSSIEHIGIVAAAVGIGGPLALFAAGLHLVGHALGKALLFFAAGNVAQRYDTRSMARIRGAASALPLSGTALLAGGLFLAGAPPSALFASELSILAAGFERGHWLAAAVLIACVALIFVGMLFHIGGLALGRGPARLDVRGEGLLSFCLVGLPLVAVGLLGVVVPAPLAEALRQAATVLAGA
ncbi:MAG TPA: hydrogenase 4 subunit F [Chloroflexota bacterium]|jgi:hydrogenase-4 component F